MQIDPIIPIIVAIIGAIQVAASLYAGRKQRDAITEKESAAATLAIGESYATLISALERRLEKLEKDYCKLEEDYENLKEECMKKRNEIQEQIEELNGNSNSK